MNEIIWMMKYKPPEVTRAQAKAVFDAVRRAKQRVDWSRPNVRTRQVERSDGRTSMCKVTVFVVEGNALFLGEDGVIYTLWHKSDLRELRATNAIDWTGMVTSLDRLCT